MSGMRRNAGGTDSVISPVQGRVVGGSSVSKLQMIWTDSRAAGCMKARAKGKIFQIEIVCWITWGQDEHKVHAGWWEVALW